jgi:hypothetical protein
MYTKYRRQVTSTPIRPVEKVVITTKGLQDRDNLLLDGRTVENKGKSILNKYYLTNLVSQKIHFKSINNHMFSSTQRLII